MVKIDLRPGSSGSKDGHHNGGTADMAKETPIQPLSRQPDIVDVTVGDLVRSERIRVGLSQTQLGESIGVTFQQIQKYERGVNRISASMLTRIARALGVSVASLFPSDDEAPSGRPSLGAITGGHELAECYITLSPSERAALLGVARALARRDAN